MNDVMMIRMVPGAPAGMGPAVRALPVEGARPGQFRVSPPSRMGRFPTALVAQPSRQQPQSILRSHAVSAPPVLEQDQINLNVFEPEEPRGDEGAYVAVNPVSDPRKSLKTRY